MQWRHTLRQLYRFLTIFLTRNKIVKPSVRIVVVQMEAHIGSITCIVILQAETLLGERDGNEFKSSIFPDFLENGWSHLLALGC